MRRAHQESSRQKVMVRMAHPTRLASIVILNGFDFSKNTFYRGADQVDIFKVILRALCADKAKNHLAPIAR